MNEEEQKVLVCCLCGQEEIADLGMSKEGRLYLVGLHLNIVHAYPDNFVLKYDGDTKWLDDSGKVIVELGEPKGYRGTDR